MYSLIGSVSRFLCINDEDWGISSWSTKNFDPQPHSSLLGTKRMKVLNYYFVAGKHFMANNAWLFHSFYFILTVPEMADKYGIDNGDFHCRPLMRHKW